MSNVKPITPKEVSSKREASIPDAVLEVFNDLIVKYWSGSSATINQDEAAKLIAKKLKCSTEKLYDNHWMDVEPIYKKAGWSVKYDKPGYNESYEAYFVFSKK
jgi:hypothetical protein